MDRNTTPSFDELIDLGHASRLIPGNPHLSTVFRWSRRGAGGCCLRTWRMGRRVFTTEAALRDFLAESSRAHEERLNGPNSVSG